MPNAVGSKGDTTQTLRDRGTSMMLYHCGAVTVDAESASPSKGREKK